MYITVSCYIKVWTYQWTSYR